MGFEEAKKLDDHFVMHTFKRKPVMLVEGSGSYGRYGQNLFRLYCGYWC